VLFHQVATRLSLTTCWQIVELQDDNKLLEQLVTSLLSYNNLVAKLSTSRWQFVNKLGTSSANTSSWQVVATALIQIWCMRFATTCAFLRVGPWSSGATVSVWSLYPTRPGWSFWTWYWTILNVRAWILNGLLTRPTGISRSLLSFCISNMVQIKSFCCRGMVGCSPPHEFTMREPYTSDITLETCAIVTFFTPDFFGETPEHRLWQNGQ
jgi:hypothetical protein